MNKYIFIVTLSVAFIFTFAISVSSAHAMFSASQVVGQLVNGLPTFTQGTADSSKPAAPNIFGLKYPYSSVIDSASHRLFVSDNGNNRVLVYALDSNDHVVSHNASFVFGQSDFSSGSANRGGSVSSTTLSSPQDISYDASSSRLFVSDNGNNRVLVYNLSSGITNGMAASYEFGQSNLTSGSANRGGSISSTTLKQSLGVLYEASSSRLFVSDNGNNRVLVYNLSGSITNGMPASNIFGQSNFTSGSANRGSSVSSTTLSSPQDISYDASSSRLFVADGGNSRVLVYNISGSITNGMPASYVFGQSNFTSNSPDRGGSVSSTTIEQSIGLSYDASSSRLFVADAGNSTSRVLVYNLSGSITNGMPASYVLGKPNFTSTDNYSLIDATTMYGSQGISYDASSSQLFVSDAYDSRVLIYDLSSGVSNGMAAIDLFGQIDQSGHTLFNTGVADSAFINGAGFNLPAGLALDLSNHHLFVADRGNNRVLVYNLDSNNNLTDYTADYVLGQPDLISNNQNPGGVVSSSTMWGPQNLTYDASSSRLFVSDQSNNRVLIFDLSHGISNGMGASYELGEPDINGTADYSIASTTLSSPQGLLYDASSSRLFVSDQSHNRVLIFDLSHGVSDGMAASYEFGQPNFTSSDANQGGSSASTTINSPQGISYDISSRRLFVSDNGNNRVLIFDLFHNISNEMPASYVLGQSDFTSNLSNRGGSAASTTISTTFDLVYDTLSSRLFVADQGNHRVLAFDLSQDIANGMPASLVIGQTDFTAADSSCTPAANIICPDWPGLAYDSGNNRLWVTDANNNRVLAFNFVTLPTSISTPTINTAYSTSVAPTNGQGTTTVTLVSGSLPPGLSLGNSTISGTPSSGGNYSFILSATDDNYAQGYISASQSYSLSIADAVSTPSVSGVTSGSYSGSGGSVSSSVLSTLLAPSASTTAYLQSLATSSLSVCPKGYVCTKNTTLPIVSSSAFVRSLAFSATGPDVKALQEYLNTQGFTVSKSGAGSVGHETYVFGPATRAALIRFQKAHGIPATGFFGPITRTYVQTHS